MNITNIKIREVQDKGNFKAGVQATLNEISVNDMKLMDSQNGMFISMPSRKYTDANGQDKYTDIVYLTKEQKADLLGAVLHQMLVHSFENKSNTQIVNEVMDDDIYSDFGEQVSLDELDNDLD